MASSKSAPERAVKRSDSGGVPSSGGRAPARKSVARSKPDGRKEAKERSAPQPPVPPVQPKSDATGALVSDRYPSVDPAVIAAAFGRADRDKKWWEVEWDPKKQQWAVPSATDARRSYRVWRRRGKRGVVPFWMALECNCYAEQSGSYLICWHKAAVKRWWDHMKALRDAWEDPVPPLDHLEE